MNINSTMNKSKKRRQFRKLHAQLNELMHARGEGKEKFQQLLTEYLESKRNFEEAVKTGGQQIQDLENNLGIKINEEKMDLELPESVQNPQDSAEKLNLSDYSEKEKDQVILWLLEENRTFKNDIEEYVDVYDKGLLLYVDDKEEREKELKDKIDEVNSSIDINAVEIQNKQIDMLHETLKIANEKLSEQKELIIQQKEKINSQDSCIKYGKNKIDRQFLLNKELTEENQTLKLKSEELKRNNEENQILKEKLAKLETSSKIDTENEIYKNDIVQFKGKFKEGIKNLNLEKKKFLSEKSSYAEEMLKLITDFKLSEIQLQIKYFYKTKRDEFDDVWENIADIDFKKILNQEDVVEKAENVRFKKQEYNDVTWKLRI